MASMRSEFESLKTHVQEVLARLDDEQISVNWFGVVESRTESTKIQLRNMNYWLADLLNNMVDVSTVTPKPREH